MVIPAGRLCGVDGNVYKTCVGVYISFPFRAKNVGKDRAFRPGKPAISVIKK
jgi:hypothetical protein